MQSIGTHALKLACNAGPLAVVLGGLRLTLRSKLSPTPQLPSAYRLRNLALVGVHVRFGL